MDSNSSPSPSPTNSNTSSKQCLVCGHSSHGYHFGILACRACAAFFRRTIAEKKVYKCRQQCQCAISKEMRNMCRACRFLKCEAMGMIKEDVQMNRDPIGRRNSTKIVECCTKPEPCCNTPPFSSPSSGVSGSHVPSTSAECAPCSSTTSGTQVQVIQNPQMVVLQYPLTAGHSVLQRMHEGYSNYNSSQKSLYTVMNPSNIFGAQSYKLVNRTEFLKMERGCLSLMFSMLNDWFQPFDQLSHELKILVLRAFSVRFTFLDSCFRTCQIFPQPEDTRYVLHYGQYLDNARIEDFFSDDKDPAESARTFTAVFARCKTVCNKMIRLGLNEIELAALSGIILWNEVSTASNALNVDRIRDRIYAELHNNLIMNYGITGTGTRLGSLLCLIHDMNVIAKEISEHVIICKIFNPHILDVWDDDAPKLTMD
uniref:Uncharacterized protein n=1 Tax=Acrobeloides nanus TaxID=290746 RepID=A0A914DQ46_9BILA